MDYKTRIDSETWAFIEETARHYPDDTASASIDEQRATYDALCRAFFQGYPEGVEATDGYVDHVPIRTYTKTEPQKPDPVTVLYMHGGGFVVGGLESHDDICAEICARTGFRVLAIDYRLAPEYKHPAMFEDCLLVTKDWLKANSGPVLLCGDSAGGNLAAATAHSLRDSGNTEKDRILGQVLIYPGLGGDLNAGSYITHAHAPMLTRDDVLFYKDIRLEDPESQQNSSPDPTLAPLHDTNFSSLPPTVIFTAECDPLASDGPDYHAAILKAEGRVHLIEETGLVHGYLRARTSVTRARQSFDRIIKALSALGSGNWPFA